MIQLELEVPKTRKMDSITEVIEIDTGQMNCCVINQH